MKSVGMTELKKMATFIALMVLPLPCGLRDRFFLIFGIGGRLQENLVYKVKSL